MEEDPGALALAKSGVQRLKNKLVDIWVFGCPWTCDIQGIYIIVPDEFL